METKYISGKIIRKMRLSKGLSQQQLAEKCGLYQANVSSIERRNKNESFNRQLNLIVKQLDITIDEAIYRTDIMYMRINKIDYDFLNNNSIELLSSLSNKSESDIIRIRKLGKAIKKSGFNFIFTDRDLENIRILKEK